MAVPRPSGKPEGAVESTVLATSGDPEGPEKPEGRPNCKDAQPRELFPEGDALSISFQDSDLVRS